MTKEKDRDIKPIGFSFKNEYDMKLLNHVLKQSLPFATYVKILIENDMNRNNIDNPINNLNNNELTIAIKELTNAIKSNELSIKVNKDNEISIESEKENISLVDENTTSIINSFIRK